MGNRLTLQNQIVAKLRWANTDIGTIYADNTVKLHNTSLNTVVAIITQEKCSWSEGEYKSFLQDRVISSSRRDIDRILLRLNLISYDLIKIAELTHAINPKDLFWITTDTQKTFEEAISGTLENIFKHNIKNTGSSLNSPDGQNIKEYSTSRGKYGISKDRLNRLMTDAESEVAVHKLGTMLGIPTCPAWFIDKDTIFSQYTYDLSREFLVHARRYFKDGERTGDMYADLTSKFPNLHEQIAKMCILDFVTRQDDRHLSNIAILISENRQTLYPLYDNGRSLFYDCDEALVQKAIRDIPTYSTSFGEIGTYYDAVVQISKEYNIHKLVNLNISSTSIIKALRNSRFTGYRIEGSYIWIQKSLEILRNL